MICVNKTKIPRYPPPHPAQLSISSSPDDKKYTSIKITTAGSVTDQIIFLDADPHPAAKIVTKMSHKEKLSTEKSEVKFLILVLPYYNSDPDKLETVAEDPVKSTGSETLTASRIF